MAAWLAWYASTPDAPCIAICSTSQGDAVCKGCGRSFDEVQHWPISAGARSARCGAASRMEGTAWRFNRYAERARGRPLLDRPEPRLHERRAPPCREPPERPPWQRRRISTAGLAGVHRPVVGGGLRHRRHRAGGAPFGHRPGRAGGGRGGLHHGLHRPDGRGAGARRPSPASCSAPGKLREAGRQAAPGGVAGAGLSLLGSHAAAGFRRPSWPWRPGPEVEDKVRHYLLALAFSLPASLLFTAYRGFNNAVSRPKAVMVLQVAAWR
jgi:predicted Fe-S protein YdhL (DUF1289 family)